MSLPVFSFDETQLPNDKTKQTRDSHIEFKKENHKKDSKKPPTNDTIDKKDKMQN